MRRRDFAGAVVTGALAGGLATTAQAATQTDYLMAWGMLDAYSWLQNYGSKRPNGMLKRPSLYDANYQPKSLRQAMAAAFRNAPPPA
jgi:endo-1,4-beta-xylanase